MKNNPILIMDVSHTYFSIARYSGKARIQGDVYVYCPEKDALVKEDWYKAYQRLEWSDFIEAVKSGVKPVLKNLKKVRPKNNNESITPSLFD